MSVFEAALLCGMVVAFIVSLGHPRALGWLLAGTLDYLLSSAYADTGLPLQQLVAAACDVTVCLLIYQFGRERWELPLFSAFQLFVAINLVMQFFVVSGQADQMAYGYHLALEVVNWVALLIVITASTTRLLDVVVADRMDSAGGSWGRLHRFAVALSSPVQVDPWWWAKARRQAD